MHYLRKNTHIIDIGAWDTPFGLNATHKDVLGQLKCF